MGQTESNLGITPGYGGTQRFPRLVGRGLALEHLILGTQIPAAECHRIGLVNRLSKEGETLNDAKALAREIAKRPPVATRLIIEAVDDGLQAPIDQAIEIEIRAFLQSLKTEDASEGIQAFFAEAPRRVQGPMRLATRRAPAARTRWILASRERWRWSRAARAASASRTV